MRRLPALSLSLVLVLCARCASPARAQEDRRVAPEDLVAIRGAGDVQLSPDGSRVAFVVEEPADPAKPRERGDTNIWVVPFDGGEPARPFASSPRSDSSPRWSPDGRRLAFLSKRAQPREKDEEPRSQLFLLRADGGEAEQFTDLPGEVERLRWSPDGTEIAFTLKEPPGEEVEKRRKDGDDAIEVDRRHRYGRLWALRLSDRKAEALTRPDLHVSDFVWSPDSTELALGVSATPRWDDIIWHSSLVVARRLTGEVTRTVSGAVTLGGGKAFDWSPDGKTLLFGELTPRMIAAWPALAPAAGGPARHILKDYPGTIRRAEWLSDSASFLAAGFEGTKWKLLRVHAESGVIASLLEYQARSADYSVSADGRSVAYLAQPGDGPGDIWALTLGGPPRRLTDLHPQVKSLRLGRVKEIAWKSATDGRAIHGVLITPPDFQPGRTCPTVVQVHGGPMGGWWSGWHGSWHDWGQLLASNGYAVLLPNPRGSTGQGWEFAEANLADWGGGDLKDILDGVDHLVAEKVADPERLGIGGWSYGGYMTSWTVTRTDRFKAAVVGAAVTNLFSFNGTTDIGRSFLRNYFLDIPFRRRAIYDARSPTSFLENVKTPCLVLHGQADERVPVGQGYEIYNGLKSLGVEAEMVVYPREPHGINERAHQLDLMRRVLAWYDKHLKREVARP